MDIAVKTSTSFVEKWDGDYEAIFQIIHKQLRCKAAGWKEVHGGF